MTWKLNQGSYNYNGVPLDTKPEIGFSVRLEHQHYEFDIVIYEIGAKVYSGKIEKIGPYPALEAIGFKVGDIINFSENHIQRIWKNA